MEPSTRCWSHRAQHRGARRLIIDAHQHFWCLARGHYAWLTAENSLLYRDFLPADLAPLLAQSGVQSTVLVQAAASEEETRYLLQLARSNSFIAGVVGWVDFESRDVGQRIAALLAMSGDKLKGLRPMIQDIADPEWLLSRKIDAAFEAMVNNDLAFDALVRPTHLEALRRRLIRHPKLRAVLDHAGKPDIANWHFSSWAEDLAKLALDTGVACKLSGLATQAGAQQCQEDLTPYIEHVFHCFEPSRVLWGSDWPVVTTSSSYSQWFTLSRAMVARFAPDHENAVFGATAARIYQLEVAES